MSESRPDGRAAGEIRPVTVTPDFVMHPEGSVLFAMGDTQVLCNVTVQPGVPRWKEAQGLRGGWITAEYALLPRSTGRRTRRETSGLRGRTQEIRRLIGRSLRSAFDLEQLGDRTCIVDCDVLQADGGTRTAAITGGYVALALALGRMVQGRDLLPDVFLAPVAAVSVGVVDGRSILDLCYQEDSRADSDINIVMNADKQLIEVQGTAEGAPFSRSELDELLELAEHGIGELLKIQADALEAFGVKV